MRHLVIALVLLLCLRPASSVAQAARPIALVGGVIVDGDGGPPIQDGVVVLRGDRIEAVGPRNTVQIPRDAQRIEMSGRWLTPGLVDAHVHFVQSGGLYTRPDVFDLRASTPYAADLARTKARLDDTFARYLASGVTAVVDFGGPFWSFDVRERANAAAAVAPRMVIAGPLIATTPTPRQQRLNLGDPPIVSASNAEEARALAVAQLPRRPEFIKVLALGSGPEGAARTREITEAVASVAHPVGVRVAVHAFELEMARAALQAGADVLVHGVTDAPVDAAFLELLKRRDVVYVTTLMVEEGYEDAIHGYPALSVTERRLGAPDIVASLSEMPPELVGAGLRSMAPAELRMAQANVRSVVGAGGRVAAGTDAGNVGALHGPAIHREIELLYGAGLTPSQVLTATTRDAAFAFSPKPDIGRLTPGYRADVLILDADPLADTANLARIVQVWARGRPHEPGALVPTTPEAVVQLQLERYNAHDLEGFVAIHAPDVEIFDLPQAAEPRLRGHAALRETYGALFAESSELRCRAVQRVVEGAYVIDQEVCRRSPGGPVLRAVATYQVEDGRIRRVWFSGRQP